MAIDLILFPRIFSSSYSLVSRFHLALQWDGKHCTSGEILTIINPVSLERLELFRGGSICSRVMLCFPDPVSALGWAEPPRIDVISDVPVCPIGGGLLLWFHPASIRVASGSLIRIDLSLEKKRLCLCAFMIHREQRNSETQTIIFFFHCF